MHNTKHVNTKHRKRKDSGIITIVLFLLLFAIIGSGATFAYLTNQTEAVVNTFTPGEVDCTVEEEFDGFKKVDVNVTNTGNTDVYIRVKLVTYRVNDQGDHIGGAATIPEFTPGTGWFYSDGYYYYESPVAPQGKPDNALIGNDGIELQQKYDDADGGKQVIEVMAEAIQSTPEEAVEQSWRVTVNADGTISNN